jgi:cytochrome c553
VRAGGRTQVLTLAALRAMPRVTLADVQQLGSKQGPRTWTGASLRHVMLAVDPSYCSAANAGTRLSVRSQDGWTVFIKWVEVCGVPAGGEALYDVKGCNGCHGADGEGAPPGAHRPAPALQGRPLDVAQTFARLPAGGDQHGTATAFTPAQLSEAELRQILAWLAGDRGSAGSYVVPENRRVTLLAFEVGGQPLTGKDGLIQMVVAMDDFVGRFSHWVSEIDVQ